MTRINKEQIRKDAIAAAGRGAKLLDALDPPWSGRITRPLLMNDPNQCLLGQSHEDYAYGLQTVAMLAINKALKGTYLGKIRSEYNTSLAERITEEHFEIDGVYYGFNLPDGSRDSNELWEALGTTWNRHIAKRLKAEGLNKPAKKRAA